MALFDETQPGGATVMPDPRAYVAEWLARRQAAVDAAAKPESGMDRFLKALSTGLLAANRRGGGAILGSLVGSIRSPQDVAREKLAGLDEGMKGYATAVKADNALFDSTLGRDKALREAGPQPLDKLNEFSKRLKVQQGVVDLFGKGDAGARAMDEAGVKPFLDLQANENPLFGQPGTGVASLMPALPKLELAGEPTAPSLRSAEDPATGQTILYDNKGKEHSRLGGGRPAKPDPEAGYVEGMAKIGLPDTPWNRVQFKTAYHQVFGRPPQGSGGDGMVGEPGVPGGASPITGASVTEADGLKEIGRRLGVGGGGSPPAVDPAQAQQELRDRINAKRGSAGPKVVPAGGTGSKYTVVGTTGPDGQPVVSTAGTAQPNAIGAPAAGAAATAGGGTVTPPKALSPLLQVAAQLDAEQKAKADAFRQQLTDAKVRQEADAKDFEASVRAAQAKAKLGDRLVALDKAKAKADQIVARRMTVSGADAKALAAQIDQLEQEIKQLQSEAGYVSPKYSRR